ncbi:uncharacterized protein LOC111345836 [Stylophora pistillata]|uniref:uncharacterized protein LOC111345836 n=1 Tax=Stylophora pistillata TaxID=50429 RepID=UPI000C045F80|nr:uncharacterized protein LOC111345836 [Stylophora pistillata]
MRQYRREAVKCEAKMFERRRERYSDLLLQVMSVTDRIQKQRDLRKSTEAQFDDQDLRERTHTTENDETGSRTLYRKAPLRGPISMHPGEMYSILELSGENLDFHNRDEASRGNRHNTVAENILGGVTVRRKSEQKNMNPLVTQMDPKIFPQEVDDRVLLTSILDISTVIFKLDDNSISRYPGLQITASQRTISGQNWSSDC